MPSATRPVDVPQRHFRDVLGHFPTGVAVITAGGIDGSPPVGLVVTSFTSVSLDPPLVAFVPARSSSTFPRIRDAGRFCVNILAGGQEALSQTFATKGADRFDGIDWRPAPRSGSPVLPEAIAWVDCEISEIHSAGDHYIVIGRVLQLEMESPALPLLFFQGGYGTFSVRSLVLATRGKLNDSARMADTSRDELEQLSDEVGLECRAYALEENELVIVATTGYEGPADRVGVVVPFHPPFGATLAAWGSAALRSAWYDGSPSELSAAQRSDLDAQLDAIRRRGWTLTYASEPTDDAERILETIALYGRTPRLERELVGASRRMGGLADPSTLSPDTAGSVRTLTAPVLSAQGPELHLTLHGFDARSDLAFIEHARDKLVATSRLLTRRFGGTLQR